MCAGVAAQRGRRVLLLEHTRTIGAKILISGGGRCNFTNLDVRPDCFLSENKHFAKSALARYSAQDFIALVRRHRIPFYEKTLGQLFCDGVGSARRIVSLLMDEAADAEIRTDCSVNAIARTEDGFHLHTAHGEVQARALVIATGGLSIPKLGTTDFAYRVAEQFAIPIVAPRPALVPLVFDEADRAWMAALSGVSVDAVARCNQARFREGLLFTHRGLSGPSILQISSYWRAGDSIDVSFTPDTDAAAYLKQMKRERPRVHGATALATLAPERLAMALAERVAPEMIHAPLADQKDSTLERIGQSLAAWTLTPIGDEGYAKAEVTAGGVDTRALSSKTMAANSVPGLHFIGEAVDVTGWLGGYNFQWAWSSAWCAAQAL